MPRKSAPNTQCEYRSHLNRRCKMLRTPDHPALCPQHARAEAQTARAAARAADRRAAAESLLSAADNFSTPAAINQFLGNLLKQMALNRIPRRQATSMAYVSQLLLNSIAVMHRHELDAQAAAAQAAANEPQHIVLDIPRPDDSDDPNPGDYHAPQVVATPLAPSSTYAADPAPPPTPPTTSATTAPPLPTPAPNPLAGKPLLHPEDPDPSTHPARIPTRWGHRVYGLARLPRRRNWPQAPPAVTRATQIAPPHL